MRSFFWDPVTKHWLLAYSTLLLPTPFVPLQGKPATMLSVALWRGTSQGNWYLYQLSVRTWSANSNLSVEVIFFDIDFIYHWQLDGYFRRKSETQDYDCWFIQSSSDSIVIVISVLIFSLGLLYTPNTVIIDTQSIFTSMLHRNPLPLTHTTKIQSLHLMPRVQFDHAFSFWSSPLFHPPAQIKTLVIF